MNFAKAIRIVKYQVRCPNKHCPTFEVFDNDITDGKVKCPTCMDTLVLTLDESNYTKWYRKQLSDDYIEEIKNIIEEYKKADGDDV